MPGLTLQQRGCLRRSLVLVLLLHSVMKPAAAQERYHSKVIEEAKLHLAECKRLPYYQQLPLWFARTSGSKDIMDMNAEPFPKRSQQIFGLWFFWCLVSFCNFWVH